MRWSNLTEGILKVVETNHVGCQGDTATLVLSALRQQGLTLETGWNLVSLYLQQSDYAIATIFDPVSGNVNQIKDEFGTYFQGGHPAFNTLNDFTDGQGYWVKMNAGQNLANYGLPLTTNNVLIPLQTGWNLIGFPSEHPIAVKDAFAGIINQVEKVKNIDKSFDPTFPDVFNTYQTIHPGEGLWVKVVTEVDFYFPPTTANFTPIAQARTPSNLPDDWKRVAYPNSMVAYGFATLDDRRIKKESIIAAFVGEECRALATPAFAQDSSFVSMVINGDIKEMVQFKLWQDGQIYETDFQTENEPGSTKIGLLPLQFYRPQTTSITALEKELALQLYPNPTTDELRVELNLTKPMELSIEVVTIDGKYLATLHPFSKLSNRQIFQIDLSQKGWSAGVYYLRIKTNRGQINKPFVLANAK